MRNRTWLALVCVLLASPVRGGGNTGISPDSGTTENSAGRIGFSAGMGVSYISPRDVVDFVNTASGVRVPEFRSAVEFFGAASVPLSDRWVMKLEYAYMLGSYNVNGGEFTFTGHLPTLVGQYELVGTKAYNVKAGLGVGYHMGILTAKYLTLVDDYSGSGPGTKLEIEANTAIGESFFACLVGDMRWDFIGALTNDAGNVPRTPRALTGPTLHFFSIGVKLGCTFYF